METEPSQRAHMTNPLSQRAFEYNRLNLNGFWSAFILGVKVFKIMPEFRISGLTKKAPQKSAMKS